MILVTGAAGKTGQAVIRILARERQPVRAFIYREEHEPIVIQKGAREVVVGDMRDGLAVARATSHVHAIYHIAPNMAPEEFDIGKNMVRAAKDAGVLRFVYHSVFHPQTEDMPHHWQKLRVEEFLFKAGIGYTILQPAAYMQNILGSLREIRREGIYRVPYSVQTRISIVDLEDVAFVAARVLLEPDHLGATYELVGPQALRQVDVANILTNALGKQVLALEQSIAEWEDTARRGGLNEYKITSLTKMFHYYSDYGFIGNPRMLAHLLDRAPTDFRQFITRVLSRRSSGR